MQNGVLTENEKADLQALMTLVEATTIQEFLRIAGPILAQAKARRDFQNSGVNLAILDSSSWFC